MQKLFSTPLKSRGFALVVTLSLMILLTLVAVGLLSLSTVSMRGSMQAKAESEARANARLALMFAIGELQQQMGPDQRVSASGAITDPDPLKVKHPHWTGVWNSWKSGTGEASQHSTIGSQPDSAMRPTYQARRGDYFRSWLLSLNPGEAQSVSSPMNVSFTGSSMPESGATAVELVGKGSLGANGDPKDYVSARLLPVKAPAGNNPVGRYGWWVGDESQKARIMDDSYLASSSAPLKMADKIFRQQAPASTGTTTVPGLKNITNDQQLSALPSLQSINLVSGATGKPAENFHSVTPFSYGVLADVREGGLKRDLSTLLERDINTGETQDPFMLYRFDTAGQERVPIQDLAAYYQLYDSGRDPRKTKGIRYTSSPQNNLLTDGIQVAAPDFYANDDTNSFVREYTSLYRSPVPIKIQMVLAASAEVIDAKTNTYGLRLGLAPVVAFWNPNNVPIVMNSGDPATYAQQMRFSYLPFMIEWNLNGSFKNPVSIAYAAMGGKNTTGQPGWNTGGNTIKASIFDMYFSSSQYPIVFEPGETRVFSYPFKAGSFEFKKKSDDAYNPDQQVTYGWKSEFLKMPCSAWHPTNDPAIVKNNLLLIRDADSLSFEIKSEKDVGVDWTPFQEAAGAGINFMLIQKIYQSSATKKWSLRNYQLCSRTGSNTLAFNDSLLKKGYGTPVIQDTLNPELMISTPGKWYPFLQFALMAGCEASETTAGVFAGRKFTSRPFLHSTALAPPRIDNDNDASFYNHGWNWRVDKIGGLKEAEVHVASNNRSGYYGGGTTSYSGTTHVIQQEIPVVPPLSIAALSHAHLGGFSLAEATPDLTSPVCTASGYEGLFPHTLQAIGNSYAHPLISADKSFTNWTRQFNGSTQKQITLADHSYLANKALWDEFFFSSITPQPSAVQVFENSSSRTAKSVAQDFFLNDKPLPNRRMTPYRKNMNSSKLNSLFAGTEPTKYTDGLADKIANHLMVEGPFNVNSTSVEAWKTVLSSLKGKPVAYLDKNASSTKLEQATPSGTPVGPATLPNGKPAGDSTSDPGAPEQWTGWRELSDTEIDQLAAAIVKQVKLRGPFLSLSEFVNRRLDSSKEELSTKGALQSALDDPAVSINASFRSAGRTFSEDEINRVNATFKKALEGPVAYGSAAYVDQADVLRNFSEQLTPRGDTFVIRTYGDSIDASGRVWARAWCEAVVQRVPEYVDTADEPHVKQADLNSSANIFYGRKFEIVTFRWLASSEV